MQKKSFLVLLSLSLVLSERDHNFRRIRIFVAESKKNHRTLVKSGSCPQERVCLLPPKEKRSKKKKKRCDSFFPSSCPLLFWVRGDHTKAQAEAYTSMWGKRDSKCQQNRSFPRPYSFKGSEKAGSPMSSLPRW